VPSCPLTGAVNGQLAQQQLLCFQIPVPRTGTKGGALAPHATSGGCFLPLSASPSPLGSTGKEVRIWSTNKPFLCNKTTRKQKREWHIFGGAPCTDRAPRPGSGSCATCQWRLRELDQVPGALKIQGASRPCYRSDTHCVDTQMG
jgi:hypothetical protein